jgi:electron transfer flavoprotein beta subunit
VRIIVILKQVPDLVEEFEINSDGSDVDREYLTLLLNEFDNHALEEALLVKDATGATVDVVALDDSGIDQSLYSALAKGADRAVKLTGLNTSEGWVDTHTRAAAFAGWLRSETFDLVFTGVQAADDLDGQLAPILAAMLDVAQVSVVVGVQAAGGVTAEQEFAGGIVATLDVTGPAVIGIQAARQAPRYVPIAKIRQVQQAGGIEQVAIQPSGAASGLTIRRMYSPEQTSHAEMLTGSDAEIADKIIELIRARGLLK